MFSGTFCLEFEGELARLLFLVRLHIRDAAAWALGWQPQHGWRVIAGHFFFPLAFLALLGCLPCAWHALSSLPILLPCLIITKTLRSSEDLSHLTKIAKLGSGGGRIHTQVFWHESQLLAANCLREPGPEEALRADACVACRTPLAVGVSE